MPSIKVPERAARRSSGHGEIPSQHISYSKVVVQVEANHKAGHYHALVMRVWIAGRELPVARLRPLSSDQPQLGLVQARVALGQSPVADIFEYPETPSTRPPPQTGST